MPRIDHFKKLEVTYDDQVTRPGVIAGAGVPAGPTMITFTDSFGEPREINGDWFEEPKILRLMAIKDQECPGMSLSYSALCELAYRVDIGEIKESVKPEVLVQYEEPVNVQDTSHISGLRDVFNAMTQKTYDLLAEAVYRSDIRDSIVTEADLFNAICLILSDMIWNNSDAGALFKLKLANSSNKLTSDDEVEEDENEPEPNWF